MKWDILRNNGILIIILLICQISYSQYRKDDFVLDGKVYRPNASYMTFGVGEGYNFKYNKPETNFSVDLNIRFNNRLYHLGYIKSAVDLISENDSNHLSSLQQLNNVHVGLGYRLESEKYNFTFFGAPALCYGSYYTRTDSLGYKFFLPFAEFGFYTCVEYTRKIFYDLGAGVRIFALYSRNYPLVGIQVHVYLSNSFKGKIKN